jgi:hypothetical protein
VTATLCPLPEATPLLWAPFPAWTGIWLRGLEKTESPGTRTVPCVLGLWSFPQAAITVSKTGWWKWQDFFSGHLEAASLKSRCSAGRTLPLDGLPSSSFWKCGFLGVSRLQSLPLWPHGLLPSLCLSQGPFTPVSRECTFSCRPHLNELTPPTTVSANKVTSWGTGIRTSKYSLGTQILAAQLQV